jgi:cobalt-zinc-cadmium efflux system membrane fusion protein
MVATALCVLFSACGKPAPEEVQSDTVVPVSVAAATIGTITARIHATGLVAPAPGADFAVVAPEPARIAEMPKAEGDTVRRGDLLVRFEIPSTSAEAEKQQAEVGRAQARIRNAMAAQARARDLFDRGVAARKEMEDADREMADAEADQAAARAALTAAQTVAARSVVRAAFDGVVAKRSHNPGDLVDAAAADPVIRVIDPKRLEVSASIPIGDVGRVTLGKAAYLRSGSNTAAILKVVSRPTAVALGTAAVPVRLAFSAPTTFAVGTPVEVDIDAEEHANVVLIPADALVREADETAVFVAVDNKAQRRPVTVGLEDAAHVEVRSGLKAGEMVITHGQLGLPDGAAISVEAGDKDTAGDTDK